MRKFVWVVPVLIIAVLGLLSPMIVATWRERSSAREQTEQQIRTYGTDEMQQQMGLQPTATIQPGPSKTDAAAPDQKSGSAETSEADTRTKSAHKAMKLGRALYDKGMYKEAKEAFEFAADLAPQLNDPKKWIAACDTQIRVKAGELVYVDPESLRREKEVARPTGTWAAQSQKGRAGPGSRASGESAEQIAFDQLRRGDITADEYDDMMEELDFYRELDSLSETQSELNRLNTQIERW